MATTRIQSGDEPPGRGPARRIQAVDRASALLKAVASSPQPASAQELALRCSLNRSTAWRLLATLEHHGLVEQDPLTHRYAIGYASMQLVPTAGHDAVARRVRPLLEQLAAELRETVTFAVAARFHLQYIEEVDPVLPGTSWLGRSIPLHATSGGKAFLAWLPAEELDALLPARLEAYTPATVTQRAALEAELERARRDGWAACVGEYEEFSNGVSAAVLDGRERPIAIVNIWGPAQRVTLDRLPALGRRALTAAGELRERLA
jgi:DNA-binding IclR family transcriptional regulator